MIFLIEYEPARGRLITMKSFEDSEREVAEGVRLKIEIDRHAKQLEHEVLLLEASSEAALRKTHRRYFENVSQLLNRSQFTREEHLDSQ